MAQVQLYTPFDLPKLVRRSTTGATTVGQTLNTALDQIDFVGQVFLENPIGGNKTISAAGGGKIHWLPGATTFSNASTALEIGIQDPSAASTPGQGDGTFDVSAVLVGGTDTIAPNTYLATPMETGSKILAHGQTVAIVIKMNTRGGVDSVPITTVISDDVGTSATGKMIYPSVTTKEAGGASTSGTNKIPNIGIEFDDGTIGWLYGSGMWSAVTSNTFAVDTGTADEYGNFIQLSFDATVSGILGSVALSVDTADFEVIIYANPLTSPAIVASVAVDATMLNGTAAGALSVSFGTPITLSRGTPYAVTIRPTTTGTVTIGQYNFGDVRFNKVNGIGSNCYAVRRLDNAGVFADYNGGVAKTRMMGIALAIQGIDDGTGPGVTGGGFTYIVT